MRRKARKRRHSYNDLSLPQTTAMFKNTSKTPLSGRPLPFSLYTNSNANTHQTGVVRIWCEGEGSIILRKNKLRLTSNVLRNIRSDRLLRTWGSSPRPRPKTRDIKVKFFTAPLFHLSSIWYDISNTHIKNIDTIRCR